MAATKGAVHRLLSIDVEAKTGECAKCGPVELYFISKGGTRRPRCSTAVRSQRHAPGASNWGSVRRPHGLTQDEARKFREGKPCAICGREVEVFHHVDHSHDEMLIRGVLCPDCNKGLGFFGDSIELLLAAANYLRKPGMTIAEVRDLLAR